MESEFHLGGFGTTELLKSSSKKYLLMKIHLYLILVLITSQTLTAQKKVRMSLTEFQNNPQKVEALKRGVRIMKSRPPSDPTSWFFQAAIHGVAQEQIDQAKESDPNLNEEIIQKFWNTCPHNGEPSANFLPWHRAYIHYFEKILRDASNDPELSLPYWDYTGEEKEFPPLFLETRPESNPLYNDQRELVFMFNLYELSEGVTTTNIIYGELEFFGESESTGFAGSVLDNDSRSKGLVERQPHDLIHIAVGGMIGDNTGSLSSVATAAFDPIFWVHHSNIDRLWATWETLPNRSWGRNIPEGGWFDSTWSFYNEKGVIEEKPISHWLQYNNLEYVYSSDISGASRLSDELPMSGFFDREIFTDVVAFASTKNLVKSLLSNREIVYPFIESHDFAYTAETKFIREAGPIGFIDITFTKPNSIPSVGYNVYLSLDNDRRLFLGVLSFFGLEHDHDEHDGSMQMSDLFRERFQIRNSELNNVLSANKIEIIVEPFDLFVGIEPELPEIRRTGGIKVVSSKITLE